MKLRAGDSIRVTKADDESEAGGSYCVDKAFEAEWDGEKFLGCAVPFHKPTARAEWGLDVMRHYQEVMQEHPAQRTNIDCMFEQLDAEGAFG